MPWENLRAEIEEEFEEYSKREYEIDTVLVARKIYRQLHWILRYGSDLGPAWWLKGNSNKRGQRGGKSGKYGSDLGPAWWLKVNSSKRGYASTRTNKPRR